MSNSQKILTPHVYPLWIKSIGVVCFVFFIISLSYVPYYYEINEKFKHARASFESGDYKQASIQYIDLCMLLPQHRTIRLQVAKSLFKSSKLDDHKKAFEFLAKITLDKTEWKELLVYMPSEYETHFNDTKVRV